MATRPKRPCPTPRCPNLIESRQRLCTTCQRATNREYNHHQRPAAHVFYDTQAWRQLSAQVRKEEPWCRDCGAPTEQADHIIPVALRPDLKLERSNLTGRCRTCHSRRTAKEHGRWG